MKLDLESATASFALVAYNTRVEKPETTPDLLAAVAALTHTLEASPGSRVDLLLGAARAWTGASYALLTLFGPGAPRLFAADVSDGGSAPTSVLSDPSLELPVRSGVVTRAHFGHTVTLAVPLYMGSEVAAALELGGRDLAANSIPALQVCAGLLAGVLAPALARDLPDSRPLTSPFPSLHDPLTGLPGRVLLFDRLHQAIQVARREDAPLAVILVSLTHLDDLTSRLGEEARRAAIHELARRTRTTLRASDTVARADEERLAVLLPGANAIGALGTVKKILRSVGAPLALAGQHLSLQANAGITIFPEHGEDAESLLARAGDALAQARERGQPSYTFGE